MTRGPDLVVTNARIATGDPRRPWATALALRDGKLAAIGSAAEIVKSVGPATRIIDAAGRTLALPADTRVGSAMTIIESDSGVELVAGAAR